MTTPELVAHFFGDLNRWPSIPDGSSNLTQYQILAICNCMFEQKFCLWHAQSVVLGTDCHCIDCEGKHA